MVFVVLSLLVAWSFFESLTWSLCFGRRSCGVAGVGDVGAGGRSVVVFVCFGAGVGK